jgi:hypothetical protein
MIKYWMNQTVEVVHGPPLSPERSEERHSILKNIF